MAEEIIDVNTTGAGAESAGSEAESFDGEEFMKGFFGDSYEPESQEPKAPDGPDEPEPENPAPEDANPETKKDPAASTEPAASEAQKVDFVEHGKTYSFDKNALESLAGAVGRSGEEFVDLYQKGCGFDALNDRYQEAKKDSELIESLAKIRGLDPAAFRAEIARTAERIPVENFKRNIKAQNPNITDEEAERWALSEVENQRNREKDSEEARAREQEQGRAARETEDAENKLREIKIFQAAHKELGPDAEIDDSVVEAFQRGVPLEDAYQNFLLKKQNEELAAKLAAAEKQNTQAKQSQYNRETSPGSAASAAGAREEDPFVEGLFETWG